jgi:response regulator RpfG family c-di-GMP phosphodiesterase
MKTHAQLGYEMLKHSTKPILQAAAIVCKENIMKNTMEKDIHEV